MNNNPTVYKHSPWLIALLYFGIALFPTVFAACCYIAISNSLRESYEGLFVLVLGAVIFAYFSYIGLRFIGFVRAEYSIDSEAIIVSKKGRTIRYPWQATMSVDASPMLQIYKVYNEKKELIVLVDTMLPNFKKFKQEIESNIPST